MQFDEVAYNLYNEMGLGQTGLKYEIFSKALTGYYNMKHEGRLSDKPVLTMVDFTRSSKQKRLWVVDIEKKEMLHHTYVAHGRNSGEEFAENFSNDDKSYMSSIGFYVTQATYQGKHGLSLKLEGLDEGFNTNALDRCVVIHGAEYASPAFIKQSGRLGRSLGCPALPMEEHEDIIKTVMGSTAMYIHANKDTYTSHYLDHTTAMAELINDNPNNTKLPPSTDVSI
ncbi:murein L,D-transpeptidase catalytic domain family protein [Pontibacter sp. BT213]|uniref:Murein L,D-transpeptidase catalytic domain family protein n=2 Tax=Pontibacter fetidus TaxID=2700082 RepID=A0A6B2H7P9_9BACT|nr:murein L,D-transpeptidase catalytic domain family protein [Pontibacter fetidus]